VPGEKEGRRGRLCLLIDGIRGDGAQGHDGTNNAKVQTKKGGREEIESIGSVVERTRQKEGKRSGTDQ